MKVVRLICLSFVAVVLVGCGSGDNAPPASPSTDGTTTQTSSNTGTRKQPGFALVPYRDKNPVLIVCSDNREPFLSQVREAQSDLQSRQIIVMELFDLSQAYPQARVFLGEPLSKEAASDLHDVFSPSPTGTTVILVGTDGKIVTRETGSVTLSSILGKLP